MMDCAPLVQRRVLSPRGEEAARAVRFEHRASASAHARSLRLRRRARARRAARSNASVCFVVLSTRSELETVSEMSDATSPIAALRTSAPSGVRRLGSHALSALNVAHLHTRGESAAGDGRRARARARAI